MVHSIDPAPPTAGEPPGRAAAALGAMAFRAKLYAALKVKLLAWHALSAEDNMEELSQLFSDFAKRKLPPSLLLKMLGLQREVLDSAARTDGHVISFEMTSRLFVSGVSHGKRRRACPTCGSSARTRSDNRVGVHCVSRCRCSRRIP